ncbi:uncharacterized protein LY89DRAFT_735295 [Mollisia scopiformis]|uniref:Uncharacterized protein n=1 Tax=Mollisia scopiformis TaxID=149040 RepID=A0A194X5T7_MOLSC|nr:uncharacterized protein LY89DRAFT_735295 [Mollisia scopiformis]KUJ15162.1 hypothetical protein LY89DRAFT_735295 [Mollisia scopiformis]
MAVTTGALPDDLRSSSNREPLQSITSSPPPTLTKRIRRKSSFIRHPDSSEDYPSSHDSIYEAVYFSGTNSDSSSNRIELIDIPPRRSAATAVKTVQNDENKKASEVEGLSTIDQIEFRYGFGTPLETITEQRSYATIRTAGRPKSADDVPYIPFLGHRDSFSLSQSPRRKASFSLDDITLVQKSYHEACATIERQTFKIPINEVYAEPKTPIQKPPDRPPTPDGMPSWTAAQSLPVRPVPLTAAQNVFQRFFGLPASGITLSSRTPRPGLDPQVRSVSAPVRGRMAPRFRPPRSVYGPIDQHPFANAPIAQVKAGSQVDPTQASGSGGIMPTMPKKAKGKRKLQRVRFTASATARDSEMLSLQAAMESTTSLALHPLSPIPPMEAAPMRDEPSKNKCPHRRGRGKAAKGKATITIPQIITPDNDQLSESSAIAHNDLGLVVTARPSATLTVPIRSHSIGALAQAAHSTTSLVTDDPRSRATSYSSTTHLMSGGLRSPSGSIIQAQPLSSTPMPSKEQRDPFCWKCATGKAGKKIDQWWKSSASCLCFICCGFDIDEEHVHYAETNEGSSSYGPYSGRSPSNGDFGPRRITLDQSPAGTPRG